jgi:type IV pilus assembly protein PilV
LNNTPNKQSGSMLLEALIAILIFSMGILAIVGLQAASVQASTDAKYRTEASLLANELIGRMWVSDRNNLVTHFSSTTGGDAYEAWRGDVSAPADGTVIATLPGAAANPPTVTVVSTVLASGVSNQVTITIFWKAPGEPDSNPVHQYTTTALII